MRFLKYALLFIAVSAAMYIGAFVVLSRVKVKGMPLIFRTADYYKPRGGISWHRFQEFDPAVRHDVIIMGSSHAHRGYDPHVFEARGYSAFNLGSSSQSPMNSYYLIQAYLNSSNTGLLIMDVYDTNFIKDGLESTSDLTQNVPGAAVAIRMAWGLRDLRALNMLTLRFTNPNMGDYYEDLDYHGLGYAYNTDSVKKAEGIYNDTTIQISPMQRRYFAQCVELCRERGIRMVVSSHYGRAAWNRTRHAKFAAFIDSTLAGTGIPYIDYTFEPGIDDLNNFADLSHLNDAGAQIFTGHLVDSLGSLGYLRKP